MQRKRLRRYFFPKDFIFKVYKTRKISKQLGRKDGENLIRQTLNKFIARRHKNGIRHDEYQTAGILSRADCAVFEKNKIHIYEIKSEKDSFARLDKQIEDYKTIAEYITVVLDSSKIKTYTKKYMDKYPEVEVICYYKDKQKLKIIKKGKKNTPTEYKTILLWKPELYKNLFRFILNSSRLSQYEMYLKTKELMSLKQAASFANAIIYKREKSKDENGRMSPGIIELPFVNFC